MGSRRSGSRRNSAFRRRKRAPTSIDISRATLSLTLDEYEDRLQSVDFDHPTVRFLREFQSLVDDLHEKYYGVRIPQASDQRDLPSLVKRMQLAIFSHMKTTPEMTLKPQKQITIRTSDAALKADGGGLPDDAMIIPVGTGNLATSAPPNP